MTAKIHLMFDIDGTLVQSLDYDTQCFVDAVTTVTDKPINQDWASYQHVSDTGILNEHLQKIGRFDEQSVLIEQVKAVFIANIQQHLATEPSQPIDGAIEFLSYLNTSKIQQQGYSISIATGGWLETARLKLEHAGLDLVDMPIASANDHYDRTKIMQCACKRANVIEHTPIIYFGDGAWDKKACEQLGYHFILVGDAVKHIYQVDDFKDKDLLFKLINHAAK